jgi:hypothetical protein
MPQPWTISPSRKLRSENKYKFSRSWYRVHRNLWSVPDPDDWEERVNWCARTFGPQPQNPDAWCRWCADVLTIRFRDAQDYEWYRLRWGA